MAEKGGAPRIPNAEFRSHLGSGGFADVYLYRQRMPERDIAVKVLRGDASREQNAAFEAEANLMARMSAHPSILSVFGAGVTEDGRSYLVMEYCPPPHMGQRVRQKQFTVPRVLDMGIRIAGAVETLHRAGILHRDIKPANILITQFGHPVLTDFGIAVATGPGGASGDSGFSVPWAPPEQQTGSGPFGPAMDVYSLAATVYTFLTERSPFEVPGGDNREITMLNRVLRAPVPRTGRADVPPELERILAIAMSKDPGSRYPSALDLAHALQQVQVDMHQRSTPVDVLDEALPDQVEEDAEDATRARSFAMIDPDGPPTGPGPTRDVRDTPRDVPRDDADGTRTAVPRIDPHVPAHTTAPAPTPAPTVVPPAAHTAGTPVWDATRPPTRDRAGWGAPGTPVTDDLGRTVHRGSATQDLAAAVHPGTRGPGGSGPGVTATGGSAVTGAVPGVGAGAGAPDGAGAAPADLPATGSGQRRAGRWIGLLVAALVLVVLIAFGARTLLRGEGRTEPTDPGVSSEAPGGLPVSPAGPGVEGLSGRVEGGSVVFTWDAAPGEGASYLYRVVDPLENHQVRETEDTTVTVDPVQGRTCLEVVRRDSSGRTTSPATECVETP